MTEQIERKIEGLNNQLATVRQERDQLNTEARDLAGKRDLIHEQIKTLQAEVKRLKEQRDEANLRVQVLKAAREKAKAQRKEKQEQIARIREKIKALSSKKPSTRLKDLEKNIQSIEWKIQTSSLSVKEEKELVDQVRVLEIQRAVHKQLLDLASMLIEAQAEAKALEDQAKLDHKKLSEDAEKSQDFHEKLIEILQKIKSLRQDADEVHRKYVEVRQKADKAHKGYVGIQREIKSLKEELQRREKAGYAARGQALQEEAIRKAREKMKRGEKLTWDEFRLLTQQGEATEP